MSCSRPRGQFLRGRGQMPWGRGQILRGRGRGRIIWLRGHTGLEALTFLVYTSGVYVGQPNGQSATFRHFCGTIAIVSQSTIPWKRISSFECCAMLYKEININFMKINRNSSKTHTMIPTADPDIACMLMGFGLFIKWLIGLLVYFW